MGTLENQDHAFKFLVDHLDSQEAFTQAASKEVTTWSESAFKTYWTKQFKPFVLDLGGGYFRVSEAFRPFTTWERFRQHVTQVRQVSASDYVRSEYDKVLVFEFFMPLTNEAALRTTLDALFFKDTVVAKLKSVDQTELRTHFPAEYGETQVEYLDRVCSWVSDTFVGYSISHVSGRFKLEQLATHLEAAKMRRYLADETTAVTRFIFPCREDPERKTSTRRAQSASVL
jgi:hypothetical protein